MAERSDAERIVSAAARPNEFTFGQWVPAQDYMALTAILPLGEVHDAMIVVVGPDGTPYSIREIRLVSRPVWDHEQAMVNDIEIEIEPLPPHHRKRPTTTDH